MNRARDFVEVLQKYLAYSLNYLMPVGAGGGSW
jgi:hypothetical protein